MNNILDKVNSLADLKALSNSELGLLCSDIREQLIKRLSVTGGHIGSNLAMIESSVALHYVFNSPTDKIVFDVSHQCYTHKLLTNRKYAYVDKEKYKSVSGFTNPTESEHDIFAVGHTSTAISLACGLATARNVKSEKYNIIAVVGDGALSGGEAWEGLNNAAELGSNFIILINDNEMSIAENHGGLYQNLRLLRNTDGKAKCNLFKALGFEYRFVKDGNDVDAVINALFEVKDTNRPTVIHLCTVKGKGYKFAETDKEHWHFKDFFDIKTGQSDHLNTDETYENLTRDYLAAKMRKDKTVVAVTAGTPKVIGFDKRLREQFPKQFVDVGIAEEHAVALISGIAKNGGKPVFGVSSTFLQRTYDQLSQDLALNKSPAVILVFFAGVSQGSQTHEGIFDMAMLRSIPNIICLAPTCKEEYSDMLDWAVEQSKYPVVIRVPSIITSSRGLMLAPNYGLPARYEIVERGTGVAVLALGKFFGLGESVCEKLKSIGIVPTLINPRYFNVVDEKTLEQLKESHSIIVTVEDGVSDGGFGEMIASFYGNSDVRILSYGAQKRFIDSVPVSEQYDKFGLTAENIVCDIKKLKLDVGLC